MSQRIPDDTIRVGLDLDALDITPTESKATYDEIKAYVLDTMGVRVSYLYIAQVKRKYGIHERACYNMPKTENAEQPKCPPEKELAIRAAMEHFGMI